MSNYVTLAEARESIQISDTSLDAELQLALDAAEAAIEAYCRRVFTLSASEARRFTASSPTRVSLDDVTSVSAVAVDLDGDGTHETTISVGSWELLPFSAAASGRPYRALQLRPSATARFPRWPGGVRVTGTWGWPGVPAQVRQAVLIQAARLLKRREAPFGVASLTFEGTGIRLMARVDPDVEVLLGPLRRMDL